ncbi:relaxin receptor 2-like [Paramacrobiotus metropolitanus]|uniref:relaxin receptor 2-like n=1 Tax=Paramacrobiotus metropolitanus TaxID=2943436 RepID=UPI0024464AC7|nr:relaxin receptor 2-like [Paramacrobiotus metropolitanus]
MELSPAICAYTFLMLIAHTVFVSTAVPCTGHPQERSCEDSELDSGTCVHQRLFCDGIAHCANGHDESILSCSHISNVFIDFLKQGNDQGNLTSAELQHSIEMDRYNDGYHNEEAACVLTDFPIGCECYYGTSLTCTNLDLAVVPQNISPPNLVAKLNLTGNNISFLNFKTFIRYPNLTVITLADNQISKVDKAAFEGLPKLKALFLQHNKLEHLEVHTFCNLNKLKRLDLSYNQLTDWNKELFCNNNLLEVLTLRSNLIRLEVSGMFKHLSALKYLELDHNLVTILDDNSFAGLEKLELVSLSNNLIGTIGQGTFSQLSLNDLDLSWNKIKEFHANQFGIQPSLSDLNLAYNPVQNIPEDLFYNMKSLRKLSLEGLEIFNVSKRMFTHPNLNLEHIAFAKFHYCGYAPHVKICTPQTDGISSAKNLLDSIVLTSFSWTIAIVAMIANVFVLGVRFYRWKNTTGMTRVHSLSIINLTVADLIMGIYVLIISAADASYKSMYNQYFHQWVHGFLCQFSGSMSVVSFDTSALLLAFMALERYIRLVYKPFAQFGMSLRTAAECIVFCWIVGLITGILPLIMQLDADGVQVFYGQNGVCVPLFIHEPYFKGWWLSLTIFVVIPSLAISIMLYCYVSVLRHVEKSRQATDQIRGDRPHLNKLIGITISNLLCWVPLIVIKAVAMAQIAVPGEIYSWLAVFVLPLNCCLNPIIYTFMTPECISLMKKICYKPRPSLYIPSNTSFLGSRNSSVRNTTLRKTTGGSHSSSTLNHHLSRQSSGFSQHNSMTVKRRAYQSNSADPTVKSSYWIPPRRFQNSSFRDHKEFTTTSLANVQNPESVLYPLRPFSPQPTSHTLTRSPESISSVRTLSVKRQGTSSKSDTAYDTFEK